MRYQFDIILFKVFNLGKENEINTKEIDSKKTQNLNQISTDNMEVKTNEAIPKYYFNVSYKNIDSKNINLTDTINKDTLINKKIAPRNIRKI